MSQPEKEVTFKSLFSPFTTVKAIIWISLIGLIVYCNSLFNGFVWDDITYIVANPDVHNFNLLYLFQNNSFNKVEFYRPISAVWFALLYMMFGTNAFFYHFYQIILHIINACLLFYFLKKLFNKPISFLISLVFLIHPINVESVAYVGSTQSELFFFFGLLGLLISSKEKIKKIDLLYISISLLLSILTKETGFLFFLIILIYRYLFKKSYVYELIISAFVTAAVYILIRFGLGHVYLHTLGFVAISNLSLFQRILNIPAITLYYLKAIFFPLTLLVDQRWIISQINFNNFFLPLTIDLVFCLALATGGFFIYTHRKEEYKKYLFFSLWFLLGVGMILQIFPLDMTVADRWFYFPIVGLLGICAVPLQDIKVTKLSKNLIIIVSIVIICLLSIRTMVRNSNYFDGITLFGHDLRSESNYDIENNYAAILDSAGNYKEAIIHYKKSLVTNPFELTYLNVGLAYQHLNDTQGAINYYDKALTAKVSYSEFDPSHKHAYITYKYPAEFFIQKGLFSNAFNILKLGTSDFPNDSRMWMYLAYIQYKLNNYKDAQNAAARAYKIDPNETTQAIYARINARAPLLIQLNFVDN